VNFLFVDLATGHGDFFLFLFLVFVLKPGHHSFGMEKPPKTKLLGKTGKKKSLLLTASGARRLRSLPRAR